MRIPVDKIGPDGLDIDEAVPREWLTAALGEGSSFRASAPGRLSLHLERIEDVVQLSGRAHVEVEADCSRCLGRVPLALDAPLRVTLVPKGAEPRSGADGELTADDLGVATYDDKEIDVSAVIHDEVFLELPMTPLCSEGCAGLCPQCGKNLNEGACGCAPQGNQTWEALKRIKLS